jgi:hypothetical protein
MQEPFYKDPRLNWGVTIFILISVLIYLWADTLRVFLQPFLSLYAGKPPVFDGEFLQAAVTLAFAVFAAIVTRELFYRLVSQFALPVYTPDERIQALEHFMHYAWGRPGSAIFVKDGQLVASAAEKEHRNVNAGVVLVDSVSAVVLRTDTQLTRAHGPGVVFTQKGEYIAETFDLRKQSRRLAEKARALTRDGIEIAANINVTFMLESGEEKPFQQLDDPDQPPFVFSPEHALKAAYGKTYRDKTLGEWAELPPLVAADVWRELLIQQDFESLFPPPHLSKRLIENARTLDNARRTLHEALNILQEHAKVLSRRSKILSDYLNAIEEAIQTLSKSAKTLQEYASILGDNSKAAFGLSGPSPDTSKILAESAAILAGGADLLQKRAQTLTDGARLVESYAQSLLDQAKQLEAQARTQAGQTQPEAEAQDRAAQAKAWAEEAQRLAERSRSAAEQARTLSSLAETLRGLAVGLEEQSKTLAYHAKPLLGHVQEQILHRLTTPGTREHEVLTDRGIRVLGVSLSELSLPKEVEAKRLERWREDWQKRAGDIGEDKDETLKRIRKEGQRETYRLIVERMTEYVRQQIMQGNTEELATQMREVTFRVVEAARQLSQDPSLQGPPPPNIPNLSELQKKLLDFESWARRLRTGHPLP